MELLNVIANELKEIALKAEKELRDRGLDPGFTDYALS
jgi:hypothetical protein